MPTSVASELFFDALLCSLRARPFQRSVSATQIVIPQLDGNAYVFGAVVMLAKELVGNSPWPGCQLG
jgi:hypothetical protein